MHHPTFALLAGIVSSYSAFILTRYAHPLPVRKQLDMKKFHMSQFDPALLSGISVSGPPSHNKYLLSYSSK